MDDWWWAKKVDNAGVITAELAQSSNSMNNGNGVLSRLFRWGVA
jgi:hypothetical protein